MLDTGIGFSKHVACPRGDNWSSDQSVMVDPLSYFPFQPVLHNWYNKGCGMCNPRKVHFRNPMLIRKEGRKEGNVLFNEALNTFYLWLYGVRHMVKNHSVSERGNLLPPHRLLFPISSKGSFICTIPQTG